MIKNVFRIPRKVNINKCELYQKGELYGIDLGSAFCVESLWINKETKPGTLRVLDMCCAPGAKYCFIGDLLKLHR